MQHEGLASVPVDCQVLTGTARRVITLSAALAPNTCILISATAAAKPRSD